LFLAVTGLAVKDFHLLVRLKVFNTEQMNQAVSPSPLRRRLSPLHGNREATRTDHYWLYDTVVARLPGRRLWSRDRKD